MPFVDNILKYESIAIIGMEKNCGKTVVLNHLLSQMAKRNVKIGVTSIGIDGEKVDIVTETAKPEITLHEGTIFATSENHYISRTLNSEILAIGNDTSSLGRVVIGKVIDDGKIMLSGTGSTPSLKRLITQLKGLGADLVIVDGALSRKSLASPSVTDAMILCTGAALSINISELVKQTKHTYNMITLPLFEISESQKELLNAIVVGGCEIVNGEIFAVETSFNNILARIAINSSDKMSIFTVGMLTDSMLEKICDRAASKKITVVVKDFTKLFIKPMIYSRFLRSGGEIKVLNGSNLVAITINPVSPQGYNLNSKLLAESLEREIPVTVYDVMSGG